MVVMGAEVATEVGLVTRASAAAAVAKAAMVAGMEAEPEAVAKMGLERLASG